MAKVRVKTGDEVKAHKPVKEDDGFRRIDLILVTYDLSQSHRCTIVLSCGCQIVVEDLSELEIRDARRD